MNEMAAPPYDGVNLYTRPNTAEGVRFNEALGLKKGPIVGGESWLRISMNLCARPRRRLYDSLPQRRRSRRPQRLAWRARSTI